MTIRPANIDDLDSIRQLFYETITTINAKDYNQKQILVWSAGYDNVDNWKKKITAQHFFVAMIEKDIAGFCSLTSDGYLDFMYIHKDFQSNGIASKLLSHLEHIAIGLNLQEIRTDASLTARPFFAKRGFVISAIQKKFIDNVEFENTVMVKNLGRR